MFNSKISFLGHAEEVGNGIPLLGTTYLVKMVLLLTELNS